MVSGSVSRRTRDAITGEHGPFALRKNSNTVVTYKYEIACLKARARLVERKRAELEPVVDAHKAKVTKAQTALSKLEQRHRAALARYNELGQELRDTLVSLQAAEKKLGVYMDKYV